MFSDNSTLNFGNILPELPFLQVKQLVDKKDNARSECKPYNSPWGESVATAGMPKIPKIKKIQVWFDNFSTVC